MKKVYVVILLCLSIIISSCKTENKSQKENITNEENTTKEDVQDPVLTTDFDAQLQISNAAGEKIGGFNLSPLVIYADGNKYTSKSKPEKHKFYTNGSMVYEVKFKSDGFKLRDENSNLLWKIKMYPDKIKVSNNEENENAFEIKKYDNKIKIKRNDEELYRIKMDGSSIIVNDEVAYVLSSEVASYAYSILAIEEIPENQKMFIIAELLAKL